MTIENCYDEVTIIFACLQNSDNEVCDISGEGKTIFAEGAIIFFAMKLHIALTQMALGQLSGYRH